MATQILLDPRQSLAISYYKDPKSVTFANLYGSLRKAGFDKEYAKSIHGRKPKWLTTHLVTDVANIIQSEENIREAVNMEIDLSDVKKMTKTEVDMYGKKIDVSKFILTTLGSSKYGKDADDKAQGTQIQVNVMTYKDKEPIATVEVNEGQGEPSQGA